MVSRFDRVISCHVLRDQRIEIGLDKAILSNSSGTNYSYLRNIFRKYLSRNLNLDLKSTICRSMCTIISRLVETFQEGEIIFLVEIIFARVSSYPFLKRCSTNRV